MVLGLGLGLGFRIRFLGQGLMLGLGLGLGVGLGLGLGFTTDDSFGGHGLFTGKRVVYFQGLLVIEKGPMLYCIT